MAYCKWSRGCNNPGPWLARIDGKWFECTEPYKADRALYCVIHAREFERREVVNTITEDGGSVRNPRANPTLLFCRRLIDTAIDDAKEADLVTGEPTDEAMLSRSWIEYVPEAGDREDFYGSFVWCCHWLSLDHDFTRKEALEEIDFTLARRLLAVKRKQFEQRKQEVVKRALETEHQTLVRLAAIAAARQGQMVLGF